jgi:hypothetical protein
MVKNHRKKFPKLSFGEWGLEFKRIHFTEIGKDSPMIEE